MKNFLSINTVPKRHAESTTWLELFFDLVYVAILVELGNRLSHDLTLVGVGQFLFLFVIIWWSWLEKVLFARYFPTDDIGQRLLTFVYMAIMGLMAFNIHDVTGSGVRPFLLMYAASKIILALMYTKAGSQHPQYRAMTRVYTILLLVAAGAWTAIAILVPTNFWLWALVAALGILVQGFMPFLRSRIPQLSFDVPPMKKHYMRHRFGELTIIILGELFIKVITNASEREVFPVTLVYFILLLSISSSLWWLYFDHQEHAVLSKQRSKVEGWVYIHYPLLAAITAYGVVGNKLMALVPGETLSDPKRILFCGALALAVASTAVIEWATAEQSGSMSRQPQISFRLIGALILIALAIWGGGLGAPALAGIVAIIIVILVGLDITWRLRNPVTMQEEKI